MKNLILILTLISILFINDSANSQLLRNINSGSSFLSSKIEFNKLRGQGDFEFGALWVLVVPVAALMLVNPIVTNEDNTGHIGMTKEVSWLVPMDKRGKNGYARVGIEYSHLFSGYNRDQFRVFTGYDYPLIDFNGEEFLCAHLGGGYFVDADKKGFFPEVSLNYFYTRTVFVFSPYIKFRENFVSDKSKSNFFDISLGIAFNFNILPK